MKTKKIQTPSNSFLNSSINQSRYTSALHIDIENAEDIKKVEKEINMFIAKDLSKHSILVLKHK